MSERESAAGAALQWRCKYQRSKAVLDHEREAPAIRSAQYLRLLSTDRAKHVDHMFGRQSEAGRHDRLCGFDRAKRQTRELEFRPGD